MTLHDVRRIYAQNKTENGCQPDCKKNENVES